VVVNCGDSTISSTEITEEKPTRLNEAADQSASTHDQRLQDRSAMIQPISDRLQ